MGRINQHDVYWVELDPTRGSEISKIRPCVVVSPNELNDFLNTVIIVPVTSKLRYLPYRVQCLITGKRGELVVDQIRTVDKSRVKTSNSLGCLSAVEIMDLQNTLYKVFCQ